MRTSDWLDALDAGSVTHNWSPLELSDGKNTARVWVSEDNPRVSYPDGDRVREGAGAEATQCLADKMGALMITPAIYEHRHHAATVRIQPAIAALVKPGGNIGNTSAKEASAHTDKLIQTTTDTRPGPWIVSPAGKGFCLCNEITLQMPTDQRGASNFGWHAPASECYRRDGKWWWKGIEVYASLLYPGDYFYIQRHTDLGHGLYQNDYASPPLFVFDGDDNFQTIINGHIGSASAIYTSPELCGLVTHDGVPLKWTRHPGVELVVEITSPPAPSDPPPDTLPDLPQWLDPALSWGERALAWMMAQRSMGVKEVPNHSNNGPVISTYHAETVRDGVPNFGPWLSGAGGNWCASSTSAGRGRTRLEGDPGPTFTQRAAGWEIERDAKANGTWRPTELAISGDFAPQAGDIGTMQRGALGSGLRHVVTVIEDVPERHGVLTIGGNEGNRFGPDTFRLYTSLLGFAEVPDDAGPRFTGDVPYQGEDVEPPRPDVIHDGDNALVGWEHMEPPMRGPHNWRGVTGCDRQWYVSHKGIHRRDRVRGEWIVRPGALRTKGKPITVQRILDANHGHITEASLLTGVSEATIVAMIATESKGDPTATRQEVNLNDWSYGMAQTLTQTAWAMAKSLNITAPRNPMNLGGSESEWREFLFQPRNSILCGAAYIAYLDTQLGLLGDPVLLFASYNAGSPRVSSKTKWGLVYTHGESYDHVSVAAAWLGDARAVL